MEIEVHVRARTDKSCVAFLEYLKESGSGAAIRAAMLPISITTLEQSTRAAGSRKLGLASLKSYVSDANARAGGKLTSNTERHWRATCPED
jgi:hypothetical protein